MNEAAAQLCFMMPTLLTRRDELFPLARQIVRDSGYQYSKGHSRSQFQQGFPSKLFGQSNTTLISSTNGGGEGTAYSIIIKINTKFMTLGKSFFAVFTQPPFYHL